MNNLSCYRNLVQPGDFVLCRVNAPLVSQCFKFLKEGRLANIAGRDVGTGLISTIKKMRAESIPELLSKLDAWHHREAEKESARRNPSESKLISLQDKVDCIACFCEGAENIDGVIRKIESIFIDAKDSPGIRLSSIHKSKGLESKRVFLLQPKGASVPHPLAKSEWQKNQELNLLYVAITRAIDELVYVT